MIMNQDDIEMMHSIQLELLEEVHRVCKECGITYCIMAGTMLGAVRHEGFIPWDKDADVALLRKEYDAFAKACDTHLNHEKYYFQDHRNTEGYRWGYGKLRRKNTLVLRESQEHMPYGSGVGIDIFPFDYVPNGKIPQIIHDSASAVLRKFAWCHIGKIEEKDPKIRLLYHIMDSVPEETVKNTVEKWISLSNKKETELVRVLLFPTLTKERFFYKKWFSELNPIDFEGVSLMGTKDYENYLFFQYGDYMTPPPKSEQIVAGNSYWCFDSEEIPPHMLAKKEENFAKEREKITITIKFGGKHKKRKKNKL